MSSDFDTEKSDAFITAAHARSLLSADQAETLRRESVDRAKTASQIALETGMLRPIDVEIAEAFAAPTDLAPGFELVDVLGYGGLGVVYRAHQPHLKRDVAIKAILQNRLVEQNVAARFQQEGAAIGRLQHPNIVSAFDSGSHNRRLYLVMELVEGTDLREKLDSDGAMDLPTALSIVRQTASGLSHALSQQIVHRDIKPGNLILTAVPTGYDLPPGVPLVKIADFGLARLSPHADNEDATRLTMSGAALGTPMYCAPEQLSGDPTDHRADIYALGATLVNMLTGKPPLAESRVSKLIAAKLTGKKYDADRLPANLPDSVRALIDDMMETDPDDRIGDYQTLIERIDGLTDSQNRSLAPIKLHDSHPSITRDTPASTPSPKPGSKPPIFVRLIAITAVLAGIAWLAFFLMSPPQPTMLVSGWQVPLFNGQQVDLLSQSGLWSRGQDAEGGTILQGTRGSWAKSIPRPSTLYEGLPDAVGINVGVDLQSAEAAEIHFGFTNKDFDEADRFAVRVEKDRVFLGSREGLKGKLDVKEELVISPADDGEDVPRYQFVRAELQGEYWFAFFNGELIGSVRANPEAANGFVQLVVPGAKVHFDDIHTYGLIPPESLKRIEQL